MREVEMRDQRTARRFEMVVPMMGWGSNDRCFDGWTRNVSTSGVYLVANSRSASGEYLAARRWVKQNESFVFLMRFPGSFPGREDGLLWAYCRAVRIEPNCEGGSACVGIAAVVEQYTLPPRMHVAFATLGADAPDSARN
jgi:hypothetical protein